MSVKNDAVIFDMDGTLVDTMRMTNVALERSCIALGLPLPRMDVVKGLIGYADSQFYCRLFPEASEETLRTLSREVEAGEARAARLLGVDVLFAGVLPMLQVLHDEGIPMYLASTGSRYHVETTLAACGCSRFFRQIHCGEPDKVEMTARIMATAGRSCVFVGDTLKDVEASRANNALSIGAGFGYVKHHERSLFDRVFDAPEALTDFLLKQFAG